MSPRRKAARFLAPGFAGSSYDAWSAGHHSARRLDRADLQGTEARRNFVNLVASCEVDQPALQQLLYDLEAGMPFLFIDQLVVQSPQAVGGSEAGRLRVLLGVSGRWQGTKGAFIRGALLLALAGGTASSLFLAGNAPHAATGDAAPPARFADKR
jgi:hypothetical protein